MMEFRQHREESERARQGQTDRCFFCGITGIIGDDLHVFVRVLATERKELIAFPAACDNCTEKEINSVPITEL